MEISSDSSGNPYINVQNLRVTLVSGKAPEKDFAGSRYYVRIQAYKGGESKALHRGAEIPLSNQTAAVELIAAISYLITKRMAPQP